MKLCIVGFLCVCAINCFALDREAFTFTNYDLNVRVEPEQQRLGVRGQITLRNDSGSAQKNAVLQISSTLSWRSIQAGGKPLQFVTQPYQSDIDHTGGLSEAIVTLPREIPPKGTVELEIGYEGTIPLDTRRLTRIGTPKDISARVDWDQISQTFTAVRGVGYVVWYPVGMESASLSDGDGVFETLGRWKTREQQSEIKITLGYQRSSWEAPPVLFCNGKGSRMVQEVSSAQFLITDCSFQPSHLVVPTFLMGNYETLGRATADIYYLPGHKAAAEDFALAADLVSPFVKEWFGEPREKAAVVELVSSVIAPYENGCMLLTPLKESNSRQAQLAIAHQLTHAAFSSPREWIYEGLGHFAQALYRERQEDRRAALDYLGLHRETLVEADQVSGQPTTTVSGTTSSPIHGPLVTTFDEVFYGIKAPYMWWMLRDMVGDDALKKALAAYRPEQDKEPSYMQHLIEAQAKRDLGWFFDDWVYNDRGLPDFRVASVYAHKNAQGGGHLVTITVENLGGAGAEVPVTLRMETGEITKRLQVRGKSTSSIRIEASSAPVEVVVNDGSVPEMDMGNNTSKVETSGK